MARTRRSGIYEIKTADGEILSDGVEIKEACEITGLNRSCIYQAAMCGHMAGKKYAVTTVDFVLSEKNDAELLIEYDNARLQLLTLARRYRRER